MRTISLAALFFMTIAITFAVGRAAGLADPPASSTEHTAAMPTPDMPRYSKSGYDITPLPRAEVERLASALDPEQARILLRKGTEPPFCGNLLDNKKTGFYACRLCDLPLFSSGSKFDSGTGWPSFFQPVDEAHVATISDHTLGMVRTEILCARCDAHLGHVFDDGPRPTGLRFCVNSASLTFIEDGEALPPGARPVAVETAYFAGGCFWGIEDKFQHTPGVIDAVSGYQGGHADTPTYWQVCSGDTGHAESVRVLFDPARITYRDLLERFFSMHDPTQLNRQGPDVGTQYRSAIFTTSDAQRAAAEAYIAELTASSRFKRPIVTRVEPAGPFFEAEEHHQDYNLKNGTSCGVQP